MSEWIPVTERIPEDFRGPKCDVLRRDGSIERNVSCIGRSANPDGSLCGLWQGLNGSIVGRTSITHWRPREAPPLDPMWLEILLKPKAQP